MNENRLECADIIKSLKAVRCYNAYDRLTIESAIALIRRLEDMNSDLQATIRYNEAYVRDLNNRCDQYEQSNKSLKKLLEKKIQALSNIYKKIAQLREDMGK